MSAGFTPGPWEVTYTEVHGKRHGIRGIVSTAMDDEGNPVLRQITGSHCKSWTEYVVAPIGADADEADFRLIAAAPELYGTLSDIMENPLFQTAIGGNPNVVERLIERALAALAKARGEA